MSNAPFSIEPEGPFSLAAAARFIEGWPPGESWAAAGDAAVRLSFALDSFAGHAGALVTEGSGGKLQVRPVGDGSEDEVRQQVERILSLDSDGAGLAEVAARDPIVAAIQRRSGGLRPVLFPSPYEGAAWSIISTRVQHRQAQRLRGELAREHGQVLEVGGVEVSAFPLPARLAEIENFPGVSAEKLSRLRGVGEAALAGRLDPARLRGLEPEDALAELREIRGIGAFYAGLILVRSTGVTDVLPPGAEPRLAEAVGRAYDLGGPASAEDFDRISDGWRPYRTWVAVQMRSAGPG